MDSIAIVTGGAGGIGLAIATKLAQTHSTIFIVDINLDRLGESPDHKPLLDSGIFKPYKCDVTSQEEVTKMASHISSHGPIRTLVNNAGAAYAGSINEMTDQAWRRELSLNLDASFICFRAFAEALKETKGNVVNVVSVNGMRVYGNPAYSSAKAGLIHFTRSIAVEYGKFGIRANAVAPGTVRTVLWDWKVEKNPGIFDQIMQHYPLNRVIQTEDVANAVGFLVSDQAAAITGVCLPVDSGLTAGQPTLARDFCQSDDY